MVGLLAKLKTMAFSSGGVQHPMCTLCTNLRRLLAINQGPKESVENYHKHFIATTDVIEEQWGTFYPPKLASSTSAAAKKKARDLLHAMIFLTGSDKHRYDKLLDNLNNQFLAGDNNYPGSIDKTLTLLSNYQDHTGRKGVVDKYMRTGVETSFAQVICYCCGKPGHTSDNCNKKTRIPQSQWHVRKALNAYMQQQQEDTDDDESEQTDEQGNNGSHRRRRSWSG